MVRRKTTLRSKSGGSGAQNSNGNGNPRAIVDEAAYREHWNFTDSNTQGEHHGATQDNTSLEVRRLWRPER